MTDMTEAITARITASHEAAAEKRRQAFTPDPELERLGTELDLYRQLNPHAADNFGDLPTRVMTYRRRKAQHEENSK